MPLIKLKQVVSFSSEDRNFIADNLLKDDLYRKWKCAKSADKSAFVILQFEKAQEIHAIDIGNESSAFIEVLVNRSHSTQDFQVLLVTSSFMSPTESKSALNLNRVRMFAKDKFTQNICNEKWDLIKVVCTQPFNKALQFGLSFIKCHSTPTDENENKSPTKIQGALRLGMFALKDDEDSSQEIKPGSFFATRRLADKSENQPLSGASSIRAVTVKTESLRKPVSPHSNPTNSITPKATAGNKNLTNVFPSLKVDTPKTQLTKGLKTPPDPSKTPAKPSATPAKPRTPAKPLTTPAKPSRSPAKPLRTPTKQSDVPAKRQKTGNKSIAARQNCPFEKIMSGVVFALSGFQNPYRSELREKALEMGAKYRPDWDRLCTHLVCAFINTPKFVQVHAKGGRIVSQNWITDCYDKKKKLSWKLFRMSDSGSGDDSSEDDSMDVATSSNTVRHNSSTAGDVSSASVSPMGATKEEEDASLITSSVTSDTQPLSSEECDTEEEIEKVNRKEKEQVDSDDAYNADTDMEDDSAKGAANGFSVGDLPEYYDGCHFFLYGDFDAAMRRLIVRYIVAFKGLIEDYMNDKVQYVVTEKEWDDNFDEALKENGKLRFVKSSWIFACRDSGKLVSHKQHVVAAM